MANQDPELKLMGAILRDANKIREELKTDRARKRVKEYLVDRIAEILPEKTAPKEAPA